MVQRFSLDEEALSRMLRSNCAGTIKDREAAVTASLNTKNRARAEMFHNYPDGRLQAIGLTGVFSPRISAAGIEAGLKL
jgi:hypothetical protein